MSVCLFIIYSSSSWCYQSGVKNHCESALNAFWTNMYYYGSKCIEIIESFEFQSLDVEVKLQRPSH